MTIVDYIIENIGTSEYKRIERYLEHCTNLINSGRIRNNTNDNRTIDMIKVLNNQKIEEKTLYCTLIYAILGDYNREIPDVINWTGINNYLRLELGITLKYENETVKITDTCKNITFNELLKDGRPKTNEKRKILNRDGELVEAAYQNNDLWILN